MEGPDVVEGSGRLTRVMGYWPSFHDANIRSVQASDDLLTFVVHVFSMTDAVDPKGFYVLEKHHLVRISLEGITSSTLDGTYFSDCLDQLSFKRFGDWIRVNFDSHLDQGGEVLCRRAEILEVVPCSPEGARLGA